jgi:hypothetical protein
MTPVREAATLPLLFLTVVLAGGVQLGTEVTIRPPSLFGFVLAVLLLALLVRSGACAPERLLHGSRSRLANVNGLIVILTLLLASAQAFTVVTPEFGLPLVLVSLFLLILLVNTLAASPDRARVLRSLLVILGSTFALKFIVLAALAEPATGRLARVLQALFEGATLGALSQGPMPPVMGYLAFAALTVFVVGVALLPSRSDRPVDDESPLRPPLPAAGPVAGLTREGGERERRPGDGERRTQQHGEADVSRT